MIRNTITWSIFAAVLCISAPALELDGDSVASAQDSQQTRVVELRVRGMVTPNCPVLVEAAARRIDGVTSVDASLERRNAIIRYVPSRTSPQAIRRVIVDRTGFDVEIVDR